MKKAIAMLLAVSATMSLGVTALAEDVNLQDVDNSSSSDVSSSDVLSDTSSDYFSSAVS